MSLPAILWALRDADCGPSEKLVLAVLCNWIDEHTDCSWPSVKTIQAWTHQSEKTVRRAIAKLEDAGLVARPADRHRHNGRFAQHVLHIAFTGPAVAPTEDVIEACYAIMRARKRRSTPGDKMTGGGSAPAVKMTGGPGQSDPTSGQSVRASIEDPVSRSSDDPVRAAAGPADAKAPARQPKPEPLPPGLARNVSDLQAKLRGDYNHPGGAAFLQLRVVDDVLMAPSQFVIDQVRNHLSTECRIFGVDIDQIVIAGK